MALKQSECMWFRNRQFSSYLDSSTMAEEQNSPTKPIFETTFSRLSKTCFTKHLKVLFWEFHKPLKTTICDAFNLCSNRNVSIIFFPVRFVQNFSWFKTNEKKKSRKNWALKKSTMTSKNETLYSSLLYVIYGRFMSP